jgi:hypothetical protein
LSFKNIENLYAPPPPKKKLRFTRYIWQILSRTLQHLLKVLTISVLFPGRYRLDHQEDNPRLSKRHPVDFDLTAWIYTLRWWCCSPVSSSQPHTGKTSILDSASSASQAWLITNKAKTRVMHINETNNTIKLEGGADQDIRIIIGKASVTFKML